MFKQVVPLSAKTHRLLRLVPTQPFDFAAAEVLIPITVGELDRVACESPIVFARKGGLPQALVAYEPGKNVHVQTSGHWVGRYTPAHLRRYPFILAEVPAPAEDLANTGRRFGIYIDPAAKHLSQVAGERLFNDLGEPTETLMRVQQVLIAMQQDAERTLALVALLEAHGLLHEHNIKLTPRGGEAKVLSGFRVVDRTVLTKLSPEQLAALRDSGAMTMIYAHLISLTNLRDGWIARQASASPRAELASLGDIGETFRFDNLDRGSSTKR